MMHTLPPSAQKAVQELLDKEEKEEAEARGRDDTGRVPAYEARDDDTQNLRLGQH
jgi:hypothetical protein